MRCWLQPLRDPFFDAAFRILDVAAFGGPADDAFECRAGAQIDIQTRVKQIAIARVADDQPILAVVAGEALRNAFDRLGEPSFAAQPCLLGSAQGCYVVEPKKPLATGDCHMAAVISDLDIRNQQIEQVASLGGPDHLLVQQLAALRPQQLDDTLHDDRGRAKTACVSNSSSSSAS